MTGEPEEPAGFDAEKVRQGVRLILEGVGEDPDREGVLETPRRVADMYRETLAGIGHDPTSVLTVVKGAGHDEMIMVRDIPLYSVCEHHLTPFAGNVPSRYACPSMWCSIRNRVRSVIRPSSACNPAATWSPGAIPLPTSCSSAASRNSSS